MKGLKTTYRVKIAACNTIKFKQETCDNNNNKNNKIKRNFNKRKE